MLYPHLCPEIPVLIQLLIYISISFNPYNDPVKENSNIISFFFSDDKTKTYRKK